MKKKVCLYNLIFPIYMLYVLPSPFWLLVLPANFLIDSLVLILTAKARTTNWKEVWKSSITRVFFVGFLCDMAGGAVCWLMEDLMRHFKMHANRWPDMLLIKVPGIMIAGVLIFFVNKSLSFRKSRLEPAQVRYLSLMLAVFTAPYTMILPFYVGG